MPKSRPSRRLPAGRRSPHEPTRPFPGAGAENPGDCGQGCCETLGADMIPYLLLNDPNLNLPGPSQTEIC
jgi:hypothetical protein